MKRLAIIALFLLVAAAEASAAVTISGTIRRTYPQDLCGDFGSCTCTEPIQTTAVRYATVEIRNTSNVSLGETFTSATGTFSINIGSLSAGNSFRLIVWAETAAAQIFDAAANNTLVGIQYERTATSTATSVGTITIDETVDGAVPMIRRALHVMDNAVKGYQYAANRGLSASQVDIYINHANTAYNQLNNNLHVQTSELWHDGTLHEYGHYIDDAMSPFTGVAPAVGQHTVCEQFDSNPAGVFAEGWANYFLSAVTGQTFYWHRWCSIESGPCPSAKSPNIEGDIAAVLWDLHDGANESFDAIANEQQKVWNVMAAYDFSHPTLQSFMTDYADARANPIECQYTGQKCETVKPVVSSFTVSPTSVSTGSAVTASYTVSDSGGSGLSRVELWRAPDAGGTPGTWGQITFQTASGNGPVSNSFSDTPPQSGVYWYGLHVLDQAGNMGVEPNPPGPVRVTAGAQQCSFAISPSSRVVSASSGTGSIQVTGSPAGCSGSWSVSGASSFITPTGTSSGSGAGTWQAGYSYAQNPTSIRQGTVTFSGSFPSGSTFTLTQEAAAPDNRPNLTPFRPAAWADRIVVSKAPGTSSDDLLAAGATLYIDWAVINNSATGTPSFDIDILIDGRLIAYWTANPLAGNSYVYATDWTAAGLPAGTHTITIIADARNAVSESNEADNQYTKTIRTGARRVRGDFNADGKADAGVFRPSSGMWYSNVFAPTLWGQNGDIAVNADYDGDGRDDVAVFRPSTGMWYSNAFAPTLWGQSGDIPVPGDYDGNGRDDIAVFRPSTGMWYSNAFAPTLWGQSGDIPVPGDYDGNGRHDIAVFRPSTGMWYSNAFVPTLWGQSGDIPVPGDYDGNGRHDIAVFRPSTGMWYGNAFTPALWGQNGDVPVPGDYNGDGRDDITVFRPSTGMWYSNAFTPLQWGIAGDTALTAPTGRR